MSNRNTEPQAKQLRNRELNETKSVKSSTSDPELPSLSESPSKDDATPTESVNNSSETLASVESPQTDSSAAHAAVPHLPDEQDVDALTADFRDSDVDAILGDDEDFDEEDGRMPIEVLASDFFERRRQGEELSIDDYAAQYPDLDAEIRELFPAMMAMESFKEHHSSADGVSGAGASFEVPDRLGDLRIIRQIGRGGMGVVYEAEQESLGRRVAVKVLPQVGVGDERRQKRFRREASAAAKLHHTNIVQVLGVGVHQGLHYYVMQLIRGVGIDELISRCREKDLVARSSFSLAETISEAERPDLDSSKIEVSSSAFKAVPGDEQVAASVHRDSSRSLRDSSFSRLSDSSLSGSSTQLPADRFNLTDRVLAALQEEPTVVSRPSEANDVVGESFQSIARIGVQVADALAYAHDMNTVHRDIKPSNLLVDEHGVVWVTDFGLAKLVDDEDFSQTGDLVGTLRYMSPERFDGRCDHRSDIHALGLTLYELCAGRPAFEAEDRGQLMRLISHGPPPLLRRVRRNTPRDLDTIIHKALAREPERRYQSAAEMRDDLSRFLSDLPIQARRVGGLERGWRWCRRNPSMASLLTVCMMLIVAIVGLVTFGYFRSQRLLLSEQKQRQVAEQTNDLAVATLDSISEQVAPQHGLYHFSPSLVGQDGESIEWDSPREITTGSAQMLEQLLPLYDKLAKLSGRDDAEFQFKAAQAQKRIGDIRRQLGQYDVAYEAYVMADKKIQNVIDRDGAAPELILMQAAIANEIGVISRSLNMREQNGASNSAWRKSHEHVFDLIAMVDSEKFADHPELREQVEFERTKALYYLGRVSRSFFLPQATMFQKFRDRLFRPTNDNSGRGGARSQRGGRDGSRSGPGFPGGRFSGGDRPGGSFGPGGGFGGGRGGGSTFPNRPRPETDDSAADETTNNSEERRRPDWNGSLGEDRQGDRLAPQSGSDLEAPRPERRDEGRGFEDRDRSRGGRGGRGGGRGLMRLPRSLDEPGDVAILSEAILGAEYLVHTQSNNVDYQFLLACCYRERASVQEVPTEALADLAVAADTFQSLVELHPDVPEFRFELAETLATDLRTLPGDDQSLDNQTLNDAIVHARRLVQRHPNVLSYSELLGRLILREAERAVLDDRFEELDAILWESLSIYLFLYDQAPSNPVHQFGLQNSIFLWTTHTRITMRNAADANAGEPRASSDDQSEGGREPEVSRQMRTDIERMLRIIEVVESVEPAMEPENEGRSMPVQLLSAVLPLLEQAYRDSGQDERADQLRVDYESIWSRIPNRGPGGRPPR